MGVINYKDFSVSPDMTIGSMEARDNAVFRKNLRIEGWLEARNLVGACKGLFASADALKVAYPKPLTGWYAFVGDTFPADIYRAVEGAWTATGKKGFPAEDYEEFLKEEDMWKALSGEGKEVIDVSHVPELSELRGKITLEQLSDIPMDELANALIAAGYKLEKTEEGE